MIVALHGFTGCPESWAHTESAARHSFVTPHLLGHGAEAPGVTTFDGEVDRLARGLREPVDLVGYSLGARLALGVAVRHPSLVRSLVLVGVNPGLEDEPSAQARREADELLARAVERDGIEAFVDRWERLPLFASQRRLPDNIRAARRAQRLAHDPSGLARALRVLGLGSMPSRWDVLGQLRMPITLVVGAEDAKFQDIAERFRDRRPATRIVVAPDAGHDVTLEAPELLAQVLDTGAGQEARPLAGRGGGGNGPA